MKPALPLLFSAILGLWSCSKNNGSNVPLVVDSFSVTVAGNYGSRNAAAGDTVHLWSRETQPNEIFSRWGGSDNTLLNAPDEWHTWFIMPARPVSFTTSYLSSSNPNFALQQTSVMGRDRMKPVFYRLSLLNTGVCYLLHGSGGSAAQLAASFEAQYIIKLLAFKNIGVIITESEEATANQDLNADGIIRWQSTPVDTAANVDYANIRRITNELIARNLLSPSTARHSLGMSSGGAFAHALAWRLGFASAHSICAPGGDAIAGQTLARSSYAMAANDTGPNVGPAGNAEAASNVQTLLTRGICGRLRTHYRSPLYPQRFARMNSISQATSTAIFNELKAKSYLDKRNFFTASAATIKAAFQANRTSFPVINALTIPQQQFVLDQVDICRADHELFSDFGALAAQMMASSQCP